jgi:hypothetical protein
LNALWVMRTTRSANGPSAAQAREVLVWGQEGAVL